MAGPFRWRMAERRTSPWIAFAAGAVAMLALALVWWLWQGRDDAARAVSTASGTVDIVPEIGPPQIPDAPRIPDAPVPRPR